MDTKYPNNIDPRPKRRKDKDNPYEIFTVGIETDNPHFYISFTDGQGVKVWCFWQGLSCCLQGLREYRQY